MTSNFNCQIQYVCTTLTHTIFFPILRWILQQAEWQAATRPLLSVDLSVEWYVVDCSLSSTSCVSATCIIWTISLYKCTSSIRHINYFRQNIDRFCFKLWYISNIISNIVPRAFKALYFIESWALYSCSSFLPLQAESLLRLITDGH